MWYLLPVSLTLVVSTTLAKHGHGHGGYFQKVQKFFGKSNRSLSIPQRETTHLIRHMLYRQDCVSLDCTACLSTSTVLQYLNRTNEKSLDEEAFHKLSVILVVFMRDLHTECPNSQVTLGPRGRTFDEFLESMSGKFHHNHHQDRKIHHEWASRVQVDMHTLKGILHDISEHYSIGDLQLDNNGVLISGPTVNYTKPVQCISPESIFEELGMKADGALHGEELEKLAALIVSHILQGYCLSPEGLPAQESFLASIFVDYGDKRTGEINRESLAELLTAMSIGGEEASEEADNGRKNSVSRNKREEGTDKVLGSKLTTALSASPASDAEGKGYDVSANCYSSEQLLKVFLDNSSANLDPSSFLSISPSIIQQVLSGSCGKKQGEKRTSTRAEAYGYGTLAVFIVTLCTLVGAVFVTIKNPVIERRILSFMMSVAIGTLLGDPALHLIPAATGMHKHKHGHHDTAIKVEPHLWKMSALLASFYVFFVIELLLNRTPGAHTHETGLEIESSKIIEPTIKEKKAKNKALVFMICIGDALHNFTDGVAIGAAFSLSVTSGVSTSLAIFCHELPHELGDFAALLAGGLTVKKAMIMNFISGCTAFIGLYVGLAVGETEEGRVWTFLLAAGTFIYIALADLVPAVIRVFISAPDSVVIFLCVNAGILVGFVCMFVIAVFEKNIRV